MGYEPTIQIAISLTVFLAVMSLGGAIIALRAGRREVITERLHAGTEEFEQQRSTKGYVRFLHQVGEAVAPKGVSEKLRQQMTRAGLYSRQSPLVFLGLKMVLVIGTLCIMLLVVFPLDIPFLIKAMMVLIATLSALLAPSLVLDWRAAQRRAEVNRHLPDVLDLLEISVGAGMGMDKAWRSVASQVRRVSEVLADEMSLTDLEIHLGASRAVAIRHMADRTGSDDLRSLVTAFIQSERFGTSIADTLRSFAASTRETRQSKMEEAAEKMSVKILFPLILFIFPVILIVTGGPAAIRMMQVLAT